MTIFPTFTVPATAGVDVGTSIATKPRTLRPSDSRFSGQGFGSAGINTMPAKVDVSFSTLTKAEADTIVSFFKGRKGYLPFMWALPDEDTPRQWLATQWRVTTVASDTFNVSAKFEENFDP